MGAWRRGVAGAGRYQFDIYLPALSHSLKSSRINTGTKISSYTDEGLDGIIQAISEYHDRSCVEDC